LLYVENFAVLQMLAMNVASYLNVLTSATYGVVLNEQHFRDLLFEVTTPPATHGKKSSGTALIMMGFPSRSVENHPSLCAWYGSRLLV
jgi:transcription initiation factor TFIIH subunit 2